MMGSRMQTTAMFQSTKAIAAIELAPATYMVNLETSVMRPLLRSEPYG